MTRIRFCDGTTTGPNHLVSLHRHYFSSQLSFGLSKEANIIGRDLLPVAPSETLLALTTSNNQLIIESGRVAAPNETSFLGAPSPLYLRLA
ncbi:hypothetical protein D9619_003850 [Psilocybe cf. subviscida]|uniref:Uncharacterized protein n=1 Tax=Psilocybe cf. subviscida TaxID=2480587 RepID=A0A8H5AXG1_9AGAR|nr:hypothetical protein D9619_003850 [Psilocybe cf. subviscida]